MYSKEDLFKIWKSNSDDFNKWRRENDLKKIFEYIINHSASFSEWMNYYSLDIEQLLLITPSRFVFIGNKIGDLLPKMNDRPVTAFFSWKDANYTELPFIVNNAGKKFDSFGIENNSLSSSSKRTYSPENIMVRQTHSLFNDVPLLDIGNVTLAADFNLFQRNLDFLSLDNILLNDSTFPYSGLDVYFSSLKNFKVDQSSIQFFKFDTCFCDNLEIRNSQINNFTIENSIMKDSIFGLFVDNSKLNSFNLINTKIENIFISNTQIRNFNYKPMKYVHKFNMSYNIRHIYENVKSLRIACESTGNDPLASKFYYQEKNLRRQCFKLFIKDIAVKRLYGGPYRRILYNLIKSEYKPRQAILYCKWLTKYYLALLRNKDFHHLVGSQFISILSWLIWGYGEKPTRIIFHSIITILVFSGLYYFSSNNDLSKNVINSIYYSIVTFTTLGYGDIKPTTDYLKLLASGEALIGAFSMGVVVAGLLRKLRN